jgi:hypothetical protein
VKCRKDFIVIGEGIADGSAFIGFSGISIFSPIMVPV